MSDPDPATPAWEAEGPGKSLKGAERSLEMGSLVLYRVGLVPIALLVRLNRTEHQHSLVALVGLVVALAGTVAVEQFVPLELAFHLLVPSLRFAEID